MFLFSSIRGHLFRASRNESVLGLFFDKSRNISHSSPLAVNATPCLMFAMPVKRKRRIDPMIIKMREAKQRKKIEKEIKRFERLDKIVKPTEEYRLPMVLHENPESRKRNLEMTKEEVIENILLCREYSRAKKKEAYQDSKQINCLLLSSQNALKELKKVSEDLYQAAIKIDDNLIPFTFDGPRETPPVEGYNFVDGDYIDISKKWN